MEIPDNLRNFYKDPRFEEKHEIVRAIVVPEQKGIVLSIVPTIEKAIKRFLLTLPGVSKSIEKEKSFNTVIVTLERELKTLDPKGGVKWIQELHHIRALRNLSAHLGEVSIPEVEKLIADHPFLLDFAKDLKGNLWRFFRDITNYLEALKKP